MKKTILTVVLLLLAAVALWFVWVTWGPLLVSLPARIGASMSRILAGMVGGLANFGQAVTDMFTGFMR